MGGVSSRVTPFTCNPIFKDDVDKPWVASESITALSIWMNPNTNMFLEEVARMIEEFAATLIREQLSAHVMGGSVKYQGDIISMTFRGQKIDRAHFANCRARDYMRNGETFNLLMSQTSTVCCTLV